jgi:RimJ/RimL family protein N-acetyltransferase
MLTLRPATEADSVRLLEWRNDPLVRAMSSNTNLIQPEQHDAFMARWLNPFTKDALFVAELDGVPVGTGRVERAFVALSIKMDSCLLGYSLAEEWRGKGLGKELVKLLAERGREMGYLKTVCRIKRGNMVSILCAMHGGVDSIEFLEATCGQALSSK